MSPMGSKLPRRPYRVARWMAAAWMLAMAGAAASQIPVTLDPAEASRLEPVDPLRGPRPRPGAALPGEGNVLRPRIIVGDRTAVPAGPELLRIESRDGFIDYDQERQEFYGTHRMQVYFGTLYIEADKVKLDGRLEELQATGNVILRDLNPAMAESEIHAENLRYNFADQEGVAFDVYGQIGPIFFKTHPSEADAAAGIAPFQQVSRRESIMRDADLAVCDFVIPHFRIRAREVILFTDDRIFLRGATFFAGDVPVMYLPFFSRSLVEPSPWFIQLGAGGRTGQRLRLGYQYTHETSEPSFEDPTQYLLRSRGEARAFADFLSKRGFGAGLEYAYEFDYGRHQGELQAYGIDDRDRDVGSNKIESDPGNKDESERGQFLLRHRTRITDNLTAVANVDWFSDVEFFYDILDQFNDTGPDRERQPVRRARGALTLLEEAYVARILVEAKDRAGIDRFNNFSDPRDNNLDFDFDPGVPLEDTRADSIARSRWGRVTERSPEITLATRYLPIGALPLYSLTEIRAINNLDKGLNTVDDVDDARVRGAEIYQQIMWQRRLNEILTLIAKIGLGSGVADRREEDLGVDFADLTADANGNFKLDGLTFTDTDETFLVGTDEFNYDDIEEFYAWADTEIKLNARITRALTGYLRWRFRDTTDDFIGDFYARIGDVTSREDLFNFRLREHWVDANLLYQLLSPVVTLFATGGLNLERDADLFPNEDTAFWNTGFIWRNQGRTRALRGLVGQTDRQMFAPSTPGDGGQTTFFARLTAELLPAHGRWRSRVSVSRSDTSGVKTEVSSDDEFTLFTDEDDRTRFTVALGRQLGPKWDTEIRLKTDSRIDGIREVSWLLQRDLHDAIAIVRMRFKRDVRKADSRDDNPAEFDISFGIKVKAPGDEILDGPGDVHPLLRARRAPALAKN